MIRKNWLIIAALLAVALAIYFWAKNQPQVVVIPSTPIPPIAAT